MDDKKGVWRTIRGRRIFIADGEDLLTAMKKSGKFGNLPKRDNYNKSKKNLENTIFPESWIKKANLKDSKKQNIERAKTNSNFRAQDYKEKKQSNNKLTKFGEKKEFTRQELKDRYGTDNVDLINAGREEGNRVVLKEETFKQTSTNPFYSDREYTKEEMNKMEENGVKPMKNSYSGNGWKGINSDKNLSTSEQAKEITSTMKKKYPDVKVARKSDVFSGGSSIDFNIMSSEKDLYISDKDIDKMTFKDLEDTTRGYGWERWANENVDGYRQNQTFKDDDVRRYAKEQLNYMKQHENQNVNGNEWYLSDYGKKVVSDLNKTANSYTYDDSDAMTDYFNHGTYMTISIGKWNKPYEVIDKFKKQKQSNK